MALNDDAVKAAAEALSEYYEGDGWGYFGGAAEAAVAAAAPILLDAERAEVERLNRVIAAHEEDADIALVEMAEAVEAESQAADRAIARKDAEIERLQAALALQAESVEAASTREDHIKAAHGSRIAAAIRAAGHPDGYHRVDTTREWAGIYCADCAVTERSARIAETAPEEPGRCKAHRDGECHWTGCPQVRDGEPRATGRHCPLDNRTAPEEES